MSRSDQFRCLNDLVCFKWENQKLLKVERGGRVLSQVMVRTQHHWNVTSDYWTTFESCILVSRCRSLTALKVRALILQRKWKWIHSGI